MCTFSPVSSTSAAVIGSICTSHLLAVTQTRAEPPVCRHDVNSLLWIKLAGCSFSLTQLLYRQATAGIHQSRWKSSESVRATSPLHWRFFISLQALSFTVIVLLLFLFFFFQSLHLKFVQISLPVHGCSTLFFSGLPLTSLPVYSFSSSCGLSLHLSPLQNKRWM